MHYIIFRSARKIRKTREEGLRSQKGDEMTEKLSVK
jgi:hypothetical protein